MKEGRRKGGKGRKGGKCDEKEGRRNGRKEENKDN